MPVHRRHGALFVVKTDHGPRALLRAQERDGRVMDLIAVVFLIAACAIGAWSVVAQVQANDAAVWAAEGGE